MTAVPPDLLIAGASGRAAAASAVRAGLRVAVADLFADADAAAVADVTAISDWPAGLAAWADRFPGAVPLMYTGGLENEPALLARLAARRPLPGVAGDALAAVRTPERLRDRLAAAGLRTPEIAAAADASRRWLGKARRGGGGRGVRFARAGETADADSYLQEFIDGAPGSAAFLAGPDGVDLLGVTAAILPDRLPLAERFPFAYCGSLSRDDADCSSLRRLGEAVAGCGLRGLFGIDFVRGREGDIVPVEVNPRYAAGMEVLELRSGRSFVADHLACFGRGAGLRRRFRPASDGVFGKRIVYADRRRTFVGPAAPTAEAIRRGEYAIADVPPAGTVVGECDPLCTVFAVAATADECHAALRAAEADVLASCPPA